MAEVSFEWDKNKDQKNIKRRGISFEEAKSVFFDPDYIEDFDREKDGEDRYVAVGYSNKGRILLVVDTFRRFGRSVRIISAWKASREQVEIYTEAR